MIARRSARTPGVPFRSLGHYAQRRSDYVWLSPYAVVTLLVFFVSDRQDIRETAQAELRSARSLEPLRLLRLDLTAARLLVIAPARGESVLAQELREAKRRIGTTFHRLLAMSDQPRADDLQRLSRRWDAPAAQPLQPAITDTGYQLLLIQLDAYIQSIGLSSPVVRDQEQTTFWLGQALARTLSELDALRTRIVDTADVVAVRVRAAPHERVQLQALATQLDTLMDDTAEVYLRSGRGGPPRLGGAGVAVGRSGAPRPRQVQPHGHGVDERCHA